MSARGNATDLGYEKCLQNPEEYHADNDCPEDVFGAPSDNRAADACQQTDIVQGDVEDAVGVGQCGGN